MTICSVFGGRGFVLGLTLAGVLLLSGQARALSIHVLDVGEGQALLLHQDQRAILVDTGHAGAAPGVLQRMSELGIEALDYLFLTHLHPDHASGWFRIAEEFSDTILVDNCHPLAANTTPDMMRWVDDALQQHPHRQCFKAGDELDWQGVRLTALWPARTPKLGDGFNRQSLVLKIEYRDQVLLAMGDAGRTAEAALLKTDALAPVDVLLVGHHGSARASSEAFLRRVRPQYAVVSINADNFRGYPAAETLQRLDRYSHSVHLTYRSGEFEFHFD